MARGYTSANVRGGLLLQLILSSVGSGICSSLQDMMCQCTTSTATASSMGDLCNAIEFMGGKCRHRFTIIPGFSAQIPDHVAKAIRAGSMPEAAYACAGPHLSSMESVSCLPNQVVWGQNPQRVPRLWNLDSLDGKADKLFHSGNLNGTGVHIYVLDTGVSSRHPQFQYPEDDIRSGRFSSTDTRVVSGFSSFPNPTTEDCFGHGTAVAGVAAGKTFGVAKNATIVAVRTLDCEGLAKADQVVLAMEWVLQNHKKPGVVQMSFTTQSVETSMDRAAASLVAAGLTVVAAAGNFNTNTSNCSPARDPSVIAVAASTIKNEPWSKSNWGPDVTMWAPGAAILSAWRSDNGQAILKRSDGTSLAAPHVSGAAALHLEYHPRHSPQQVLEVLMRNARRGQLTGLRESTPNVLLGIDPRANIALVEVSTTDLGDEPSFAGMITSKQMNISNVGSATMTFTINVLVNGIFGGWLSVEPSSGVLEPETTMSITISYDTVGMMEGQYSGRLVIDSDALNNQVEVSASLLVLCDDFIDQDQSAARTVTFLEDFSIAAHNPSAPWPDFGANQIDPLKADIWVQFAVRFSHPVKAIPQEAIVTSSGTIIEVRDGEVRAKMCGEYVIRLRVTVEPWAGSKSTICISLQEGLIEDIYGYSFPEAHHCLEAQHRPYARMFGMNMVASRFQEPSTNKSDVPIILAFSKPIDTLSLGIDSFVISSSPTSEGITVQQLQQAHPTAPFWTVLLHVPDSYFGLISITLGSETVIDPFGNPVMPLQPLEFWRDLNPPLIEPVAFQMTATPGMFPAADDASKEPIIQSNTQG